MDAIFFRDAAQLRAWLEKHHNTDNELWIGYYKKAAGKLSVTYRESVDEALCFGWIDGLRKSRDEHSYVIRFTPRRPRSIWSRVNIQRVEDLIAAGRMMPAGHMAFERRDPTRSDQYSFENRPVALGVELESRFREHARAWEFFSIQAPWYQRTAVFWVLSAKKEETRRRRLATLIADSEKGRRIGVLSRPERKPAG